MSLNVESAEDLVKAPLRIDYDRQLLKLISVSSGGMFSPDGKKENLLIDLGKGEIDLSLAAGSPGVNGSGSLIKMTFISLAKGDAAIRIADAKLANSKNENLDGNPLPELTVKIQ
jgi:hypothetical protein